MYSEIQDLIRELKRENQERSEKLNSGGLSEYSHSAYVHCYNNTLDIIKRLEKIVGTVS